MIPNVQCRHPQLLAVGGHFVCYPMVWVCPGRNSRSASLGSSPLMRRYCVIMGVSWASAAIGETLMSKPAQVETKFHLPRPARLDTNHHWNAGFIRQHPRCSPACRINPAFLRRAAVYRDCSGTMCLRLASGNSGDQASWTHEEPTLAIILTSTLYPRKSS